MKKKKKRFIDIDNFFCKLELFSYYLIAFSGLGIVIYGIYIVASSLIAK